MPSGPEAEPAWTPNAPVALEPAWTPAAQAEAEPEWMPPPPPLSFDAAMPSASMPQAAAPAVRAPLLLDVTPLTLGLETVGGYCEGVIERNAAIPVEQTRVFSTGQDDQQSVSVRIVQGESRRLDENQPLGQLELTGLRQAARGDVRIEVTFLMDADGTLGVRAVDVETGRQQSVRINLVGGVADEEILRMQERQARVMGS
jgi:molecular chaperone DnaK